MARRLVSLAFAAGILLGFAFGTGSDPGTSDAYARAVGQICTDAAAALAEIPAPATSDDFLAAAEQSLAINRTAGHRLRAVTPPIGAEEDAGALLIAMDAANAAQARLVTALRADARARVERASDAIRKAQNDFRTAARALGLDACVRATGDAAG